MHRPTDGTIAHEKASICVLWASKFLPESQAVGNIQPPSLPFIMNAETRLKLPYPAFVFLLMAFTRICHEHSRGADKEAAF